MQNRYKKIVLSFILLFFLRVDSFAYTNSIGIEFVLINSGSFIMGSPDDEKHRLKNEKEHKVIISNDFYISKTEVTQKQWMALMQNNPAFFRGYGGDYPIESISWFEAKEFIDRLNALESTNKYRLPTEAEWEYAARANSSYPFPFGKARSVGCQFDRGVDEYAWYCGNSKYKGNKQAYKVATKSSNDWGLYDMQGNVAEWCLDSCKYRNVWTGFIGVITNTYEDNIRDPLSKKGDRKVVRGGSWNSSIKNLRFAKRDFHSPKSKKNNIGFRIVREK